MSFWVEEKNRKIRGTKKGWRPELIPTISTRLDSVRSYGFEIDFGAWGAWDGHSSSVIDKYTKQQRSEALTRAVKHLTGFGYNSESIEIKTVDDGLRVKREKFATLAEPSKATITFDNLLDFPIHDYLLRIAKIGFKMKVNLDLPSHLTSACMSAEDASKVFPGSRASSTIQRIGTGRYKMDSPAKSIKVKYFDVAGELVQTVTLADMKILGITTSEQNYSENDFHSIEMEFTWNSATADHAA